MSDNPNAHPLTDGSKFVVVKALVGENVYLLQGDDAQITLSHAEAAQDGLVDALRYARSQIVGLAVSGTDRIDELCRKLQKLDPSPIWPIPFPDPPERTWQPIVKKIDAALASIEVKSS